ncbi:MAG: hypothetical protein JNJ54_14845 [Myxococcaceae bacterium]|nr:hypothetical protein [Myxococcaceae bacterium]
MSKADKEDDEGTIENRVYLFESLARGFVEKAADDLSGKNPERRARALKALADLAYVSCVVADTGQASPKAVRRRVLAAIALEAPVAERPEDEESDEDGDDPHAED